MFCPFNTTKADIFSRNDVIYQMETSFHEMEACTHRLVLTQNFIFLVQIPQLTGTNLHDELILASEINF